MKLCKSDEANNEPECSRQIYYSQKVLTGVGDIFPRCSTAIQFDLSADAEPSGGNFNSSAALLAQICCPNIVQCF